jgi:MFS family permease
MAFLAWGLGFYGVSVYLVRLREANGWSAAAISSAVTFYNLVTAGLVMLAGDAIERWGARVVVIGGAVSFGLGAALLPLLTSLWQLYAVFVAMALGFAATGGGAINTILAQWFEAKRGLAISLALNGASAAGILVTPAMVWLTARFGFAHGLWLLILMLWALLLPIAFRLLRDRPDVLGLSPDGSAAVGAARAPAAASRLPWSALASDRNFQTVTLAFGLGLTAQVGFLTHQIAYLATLMSVETAGWCASMIAVAALAGRLGGGLFIDRLNSRLAAAGNFLLQAGALGLLLWSPSTAVIYIACALFGLTVGNMITFPGLVVQREFAREHFARAISLVIAIDQVILAFGPGLLGALHDLSGGYASALALCVLLDIGALAAILWRRPRAGMRERVSFIP